MACPSASQWSSCVRKTGLDMAHVPCKSAGPATVELLGGKIAFALVGTRGCFHISRPERFVRCMRPAKSS